MLRTLRVLVAGPSEMPEAAVNFAQKLGQMLMHDTPFILVTGGVASSNGTKAADNVVAQAALDALGSSADIEARIETVVPQTGRPNHHGIGRVIRVKESDRRTRRYSMVINTDAVLAFSGDHGTPEIVDLAFFAKKPLILFPTFGDATGDCWPQYRGELIDRLRLTDAELTTLQESRDNGALVTLCHTLLLRALRPGCFVAIPFKKHPLSEVPSKITETVEALGYQVVQLDRENFTGSAIDAIWRQIERAALVIADLTGARPNVYYEVGIAHALRKPTTLLIYSKDEKVPKLPFDLRDQQILVYSNPDRLAAQLRLLLKAEHYVRELPKR